jgi:hypothetical protein
MLEYEPIGARLQSICCPAAFQLEMTLRQYETEGNMHYDFRHRTYPRWRQVILKITAFAARVVGGIHR